METVTLSDCVSCIDFSPLGDYFAVGCIDETIKVWSANFESFKKEPAMTREGFSMGVVDIKFNTTGTNIAVSSLDSVIRNWDFDSNVIVAEAECGSLENWKLAFKDRNIITAGELGRVSVYDSNSLEKMEELKTEEVFACSVAMAPNSDFLAVGNSNGVLYVFNRQKENQKLRFQLHHKMLRTLSFTEGGSKIISGSDDNVIRVFDIESEKPVAELNGHKQGVTSVDGHPEDSSLLLSASLDKSIKIWDIRTKSAINSIAYHNTAVWAAKFNVNGKYFVSGAESGVVAIHKTA